MDFIDLTKLRCSVRKFSEKNVEREKIDLILEAGRLAPTAANRQPQRVIVLDSAHDLEALKECTPFHFQAPLALVICYDRNVSWKRSLDGKDMGEVDASIVTTHMMLQVAELGLGSTWVGHFDPLATKQAFSLPDDVVPVALLPIGYPAEGSSPHPNHAKRFDRKMTVTFRPS